MGLINQEISTIAQAELQKFRILRKVNTSQALNIILESLGNDEVTKAIDFCNDGIDFEVVEGIIREYPEDEIKED